MANPRAVLLHDDARTTAMVRGILSTEGFDVVHAPTPFRLLEVAVDGTADLVLVGLGGLDERDLELVGVLRRRWPRAVLLLLFPGLLRDRAARALDLGADGYLPEPFYPSEISALARAAAVRAKAAQARTAEPAGLPGARPADEQLSKLAAGVAHTIRNPLQIVELQIAGFETDAKLDVAALREQLARIAGVAESLARFAGRRKLNTRAVDVNSLVERVFGTPGRGGRPPATVRLAEDRLEVHGAPDLLRAAFDAVHDRAHRVTPEAGTVSVSTALVEVRGEPFAEVSVTDGGPALAPERLAAFFDPFPDADQVTEGTGMELAAAAGIVRNHGGSATARAAGPAGTTVVLRLPLRRRSAGRPGEAP